MKQTRERKIYILLTRFPDNGSKLVGFLANSYYTHVSIGLEEDLNTFYSFVKKGFLVEKVTRYIKPDREPFPCRLYELKVSEKVYASIEKIIHDFVERKQAYRYTQLGVVLGLLHIPFVKRDHYFCSQFVAEVLKKSEALPLKKHCALYFPRDFVKLSETSLIFQGNLSGYTKAFAIA